jgi:predicted Zn-dependent protease
MKTMTTMLTPNTPSFTSYRTVMLGMLCAAALTAGCGTKMVNPVTGKTERLVMDEQAEIAQGKEAHEQVIQEYGVYNNPAVQAYVNDVGQRLAKQSHRANLTWHFTVLDSPEVNAFALPGGYVYVTRGIMAYMDSEADLAGVIGHEIGHVTAKHGAQRATKQQNAGLGVLAASVLGAVLESQGMKGAGQIASDVSQSAAAGYIAKYGREQELQADGLGAEYLSRNQYNPKNMIDVIKVLEQQERFAADRARAEGRQVSTSNNWLSSHPSNQKRLEDISQLATKYAPAPGKGYQDDGRERYLKVVQGMDFGDSREQGVVRGQHFYHEPLNFALTAPIGWKIQNSPEQLVVINNEGTAGLIMQVAPKDAGADHANIIRQAFKPTSGQLQNTTINGLKASRFRGQAVNAQGQAYAVNATVVTSPTGMPFLLVPSARDANAMAAAREGFAATEMSFRALSAADKAVAKPWAIKTLPYPRGGFAKLAEQSALGALGEGQLRLLNGYYGGGEPALGQRVKTVVAQP